MVEIIKIKGGSSNCYLVKENGKTFLIDSGNIGYEKKIIKQLHKNGVKSEDISLLILTHGHMDHAGTAEYFKNNFNVKIAMNDKDIKTTEPLKSKGFLGKIILTLSKRVLKKSIGVVPDIILRDNQNLNEFELSAKVISLQGHTQGSIGILFDDGKLIAGDMYMNFIRPNKAHLAEDFTQLNLSDNKIKDLQPTLIYPGHGKAFTYDKVK